VTAPPDLCERAVSGTAPVARNRPRGLKPAVAVVTRMSDPNDPERGDFRAFSISVAISLALVVLALQVYAGLGMI
jgi:hypothetical protein